MTQVYQRTENRGKSYTFLLKAESTEFTLEAIHRKTNRKSSVVNVNGISADIADVLEELTGKEVLDTEENSWLDLESFYLASSLVAGIADSLQPEDIKSWEWCCDKDRAQGEWDLREAAEN